MHEIREGEEEENVSTTEGVKSKGVGLWEGRCWGGLGKEKKIIPGREDSKYKFCECEKNKRGLKRK